MNYKYKRRSIITDKDIQNSDFLTDEVFEAMVDIVREEFSNQIATEWRSVEAN